MKKKPFVFIFTILGVVFLTGILHGQTRPVQAIPDSPIYVDALDPAWQDWSYNSISVNYSNAKPVHAGTASIAVTYTGGWSGLQIGFHGATLDIIHIS